MEEELIEIRCPLKVAYNSTTTGRPKEKICDKRCLKVAPGSKGEAWCNSCHKAFDFEVADQNSVGFYMPATKQDVN